jgi:hypothetical protein
VRLISSVSPIGTSRLFAAPLFRSLSGLCECLSHANDLQEMLIIQTEYMQALANAFGEQPKVLTDSYAKTASDAMKNPL